MNSWIFQGNPDKFDIDDYLRQTDEIYWSVSVPKYQKLMKIGDEVFIWRAKGKQKAISGIIAYGVVNEECASRDQVKKPLNLYDSHWKEAWTEASEIKAGVVIKAVRLTPQDGMLTSDVLQNDPYLANMRIFTVRVGSNFLLDLQHSQLITQYWLGLRQQSLEEQEDNNYIGIEGQLKLRVHKVRERDPNLRKLAIGMFLEQHGQLFCEICGFCFEDTYGDLGKNFIEVHHLKPISRYADNEHTPIENLRLVCSNCHRMVHRGDPYQTYFLLKDRLN